MRTTTERNKKARAAATRARHQAVRKELAAPARRSEPDEIAFTREEILRARATA